MSGPYNPVSFATNYSTTAWWIAFAFTLTATVVFFVLSYIRNVKPEARLIYYLVTSINGVSALAYLLLATGTPFNGAVGQSTAYSLKDYGYTASTALIRQFFWLRFAAWAWAAPLTLVILGLVSGAHWVEITWTFFFSLISLAALFAASTSGGANATWPLFAFGVFAGIPIFIALVYTYRKTAYRVHAEIGRLYDVLGFSFTIMLAAYAISWAVSEGGMITTIDQETIIYATLDVITKALFGFVLIWSREAIARYGTFLGVINTGIDFDFPIARSVYTGSGSAYAAEPTAPSTMGEHRDLAFAQLHAATKTTPAQVPATWPVMDVTAQKA